jgi:uncharacterized membrane protein YgdD (TMEM256/DUF423 family)
MEQALASTQPLWRRAIWMRLASFSGLIAVLIWVYANVAPINPALAANLRLGATVQFMHSMATFSCATFMNIGARDARHAPAAFLPGILLFSGAYYFAGGAASALLFRNAGLALLALGWLILAWSARTIDLD